LDEGLVTTYRIEEENRPLYWRRMIDAKRPETIPLMGGCMWDGAGPTEYNIPPQVQGKQEDYSGMSVFCLDRHNGGPSMLFLDTSSRKVGLKELWRLRWHRKWDKGIHMPSWPDWMRKYKDYD